MGGVLTHDQAEWTQMKHRIEFHLSCFFLVIRAAGLIGSDCLTGLATAARRQVEFLQSLRFSFFAATGGVFFLRPLRRLVRYECGCLRYADCFSTGREILCIQCIQNMHLSWGSCSLQHTASCLLNRGFVGLGQRRRTQSMNITTLTVC